MPTTTPDGIYYADSSTAMSAEAISAAEATSVQDALTAFRGVRQIQTFVWANSAARSAQSGMIGGDIGYQSDTKIWYRYSGSVWFDPNAYAKLTNTTSIPHNTATILGATSYLYVELADASLWHSTSVNTDRITPNIPGRYRLEVIGAWASNSTGLRYYWIGKNGSFDGKNRKVNSNTELVADPNGATFVAMDTTMNGTTDYFTVQAFQTSGAGLACSAEVVVTYLGPA